MMTEIREILLLAARAAMLSFRKVVPKPRRRIYLTRRDDDSDWPNGDIYTGRGIMRMKKVRSGKR